MTTSTPAANSSWALPGGMSAIAVTTPQTTMTAASAITA